MGPTISRPASCLNDVAVCRGLPWVYGGCVGAEGRTMTIVPGRTPCLRCLLPDCPPPGSTPTCDTAGILEPIVGLIAAIEAIEAIKILSGQLDALSPHLTVVDLWTDRIRQLDLAGASRRGRLPVLQAAGVSLACRARAAAARPSFAAATPCS